MDKRYEPLKDYGRVNKKPKLEINVNKGRPYQSTIPGPSRSTGKFSPPKSSPDDFWDDDDDEVILLASQVVEKEIPRGQTISSSIQASEFTFSEFAPNAKITSTQKITAPDVELFSNLLDDDWEIENIAEEPVFKKPCIVPPKKHVLGFQKNPSEKNLSERPFSDIAKSSPFQLSQTINDGTEKGSNSIPITLSQPSTSNKAANREKAHECQIQFLQKRADTLKKENIKINKELEDFRNKMESKDGEVSLLRDEIRHLKQQIQNAQREKLQCKDVARGEWQDKIIELSKQVEAQQTVLEFKTMEISKLKMNHGEESMRFENSMRESANESMSHQANIKITTPNRRRMIQIQSSPWLNVSKSIACSIPIEIFDISTDKGSSKFRKDIFQREMESLQFKMSRLQYTYQLKRDELATLAHNVIDSAKSVIAEFWTYVHSLEYSKHCQSLPYHTYDVTKDARKLHNRCNLFQAGELFLNEKAINLRRYIAGLSVVCRIMPEASCLLFTIHHNDYLLIEIITDALNKLGFSNEICQHFGVLESFSLLLRTLCENHSDEHLYHEHLMSLLKTLVFSRPNAWASKYISHSLLKISAKSRLQLCSNSRTQSFTVSQSIYKFTPESCFLQVYASLLETAFPSHQELTACHFKLLCDICYNHVNFFTNCFTFPPPFVNNILPYDDDLEDDAQTQRFGVNIKCQCYVMICSSVVKLLYQVMRHWHRLERRSEQKLVENISKVGVHLLHTIYIRYYMTKLFDHKAYLTRHYLYFICKYWLESENILNFGEIHRDALNQLASSHLVEIKTTTAENSRSTSKIDRDLAKWFKQSGDVRPGTIDSSNEIKISDLIKLRIPEKSCNPEAFFKRY